MELDIPFLIPANTGLDEAEFDRLFLELYPRICAVAFRMVGDPDLAEDLASDAFWKLWTRPPAKRTNLTAWLYRVVINLGYNALRAGRRRLVREQSMTQAAKPPSNDRTAEALVDSRQEIHRVRIVLAQMPRRDVQILLLRHSGLSYKEIAESLSVAPASVGTLLNRAEKKFAFLYQKGEDHAPQR